MPRLLNLPVENLLSILDLLSRRDLENVSCVSKAMSELVTLALDKWLRFSISPACTECWTVEQNQIQHLARALNTLSDPQRARRVQSIEVTDENDCECITTLGVPGIPMVRAKGNLYQTLLNLAQNMKKLRRICIRTERQDPSNFVKLFTGRQITSLSINQDASSTINLLQVEHTLQQLSFSIAPDDPSITPLPRMKNLRELRLNLVLGPTADFLPLATRPSKFNLELFESLRTIHITGTAREGFTRIFSNQSVTITECNLAGSFHFGSQDTEFSKRIPGVERLSCSSSAFSYRFLDSLNCLRFLSLEKISGVFPFTCPNLECLRVTGHGHTKNDLSELLALVLSSQELKLKALDLRYTGEKALLLSCSAIGLLARCWSVSGLILDGFILLDGRDWINLVKTTALKVVVRIRRDHEEDGNNAKVFRQPIPEMLQSENGYSIFSCKDKMLTGDCRCGHLSRSLVYEVVSAGLNFMEVNAGRIFQGCHHAAEEYSSTVITPISTGESKRKITEVVGACGDAMAICLPSRMERACKRRKLRGGSESVR